MDVALHRLPVTFVLDRAGVTGEDGASHNGMWDLSILQVVPGHPDRRAPRRGDAARGAARGRGGRPTAPPRSASPRARSATTSRRSSGGGGRRAARASPRTACCSSPSGPRPGSASRSPSAAPRRASASPSSTPAGSPRCPPSSSRWPPRYDLVVTVEDNGRVGGVGALVSQALRDAGVDVPARDVGIPPRFLDHGSVAQVKAEIGLTAQDVARTVVETRSPALDAGRSTHPALTGTLPPAVIADGAGHSHDVGTVSTQTRRTPCNDAPLLAAGRPPLTRAGAPCVTAGAHPGRARGRRHPGRPRLGGGSATHRLAVPDRRAHGPRRRPAHRPAGRPADRRLRRPTAPAPTAASSTRLNELDGFDLDPRLALHFDAPVDGRATSSPRSRSGAGELLQPSTGWSSTTPPTRSTRTRCTSSTRHDLHARVSGDHGLPAASTTFTTLSATDGLVDLRYSSTTAAPTPRPGSPAPTAA